MHCIRLTLVFQQKKKKKKKIKCPKQQDITIIQIRPDKGFEDNNLRFSGNRIWDLVYQIYDIFILFYTLSLHLLKVNLKSSVTFRSFRELSSYPLLLLKTKERCVVFYNFLPKITS